MGKIAAPEILQDDVNFRLEVIDWNGQKAVKKTAKPTAPKSRVERIKNDIYGMRFFAEMEDKFPHLKLSAPKVYEEGSLHYIREFIEDDPVAQEDAESEQASARLERLAKLLADIDRIEPYGEVKFVGSSNWKNLYKSIERWSDENVADSLITEAQAGRIKEISADLGELIRPRIAHGDMSPYKHAYLRPDNKITFIDCENFTPEAARYFDVAWSYTRLWSFALTTDIPKQFLSAFLAEANQTPNQAEQLMAVLIQRTLGMQKDADADLKNKGVDFRNRAQELMELVLENKLEVLHS
jgi:hypothetical protein